VTDIYFERPANSYPWKRKAWFADVFTLCPEALPHVAAFERNRPFGTRKTDFKDAEWGLGPPDAAI